MTLLFLFVFVFDEFRTIFFIIQRRYEDVLMNVFYKLNYFFRFVLMI